MISVLILTKNEEQDLPGCLDSVSWCDDIHVFDSMSIDRTPEIARAKGAHCTQHAFRDYAAQRNAALETLPFRHEWIFILDADERPTPQLSAEIQRAVAAAPGVTCAFRLRRRDYLNGAWLRHAQISPLYIRLIRRGRACYTREVNEVLTVDGDIADLRAPLDHYPFSKGISHWIAKHNIYSTMEAQVIASGLLHSQASWRIALFGRSFHQRRVAQKAIFYRLPGRPVIKWLYMIFVRGAFLDGAAGVTYCNLQAAYEYMIVLKTRELLSKKPGGPASHG